MVTVMVSEFSVGERLLLMILAWGVGSVIWTLTQWTELKQLVTGRSVASFERCKRCGLMREWRHKCPDSSKLKITSAE